jgi:hypothetical protein
MWANAWEIREICNSLFALCSAPPPPPPKDTKCRGPNPVESDEEKYFTADTKQERQISAYRMPPRKKVISPSNKSKPKNTRETSGSDVGMTNHILAHEKGKGACFATPVVKPTSLLYNARKVERERRKQRVEPEAKIKRMGDEYEATISQPRILESEQTDLEGAKEPQRDLLNDVLAIPPSQGRSQSEGAQSAAGNSTYKDEAPTRPETDPRPTLSPKLIDMRKSTANETNPSRKEGKLNRRRSGESERKTRDPACTNESADNATRRCGANHAVGVLNSEGNDRKSGKRAAGTAPATSNDAYST